LKTRTPTGDNQGKLVKYSSNPVSKCSICYTIRSIAHYKSSLYLKTIAHNTAIYENRMFNNIGSEHILISRF